MAAPDLAPRSGAAPGSGGRVSGPGPGPRVLCCWPS